MHPKVASFHLESLLLQSWDSFCQEQSTGSKAEGLKAHTSHFLWESHVLGHKYFSFLGPVSSPTEQGWSHFFHMRGRR